MSTARSSNGVHQEQNDNKFDEKHDCDNGRSVDGVSTSFNTNQRRGGSSSGINLMEFPSRLSRVERFAMP